MKKLAISLADRWDNHFDVYQAWGHVRFFSVRSLSRMLREERFGPARFGLAGRLPFFWKSMIAACVKPS